MGFMGFGKKKEEDLDIPPPPPMQSASKNVLPPETPMKEWDIPPISKPSMSMPAIPDFDDLLKPTTTPRVVIPPKPVPHKPEPKPAPMPAKPSMPPMPSMSMSHHEIPEGKPVFIEINKYKQALKDLNNVKASLKQSDDEISELVGDIADEEKAFSKLHSRLSEVEKKLIQLEGSLFTE